MLPGQLEPPTHRRPGRDLAVLCVRSSTYSPLLVDALLAFAAALVSLRLSGDLVRRYRDRRAPELAAWAAGLAAYAVAAGALAWGAAAGWSDAAFRVYYLGGGLLTAALLGTGSLLLVGKRWMSRAVTLPKSGVSAS